MVQDIPIPGAITPMDGDPLIRGHVSSVTSKNPLQKTNQVSRNESTLASSSASSLMVKTTQNFLRSSFSRQKSVAPKNGKRHQITKRKSLEEGFKVSNSRKSEERLGRKHSSGASKIEESGVISFNDRTGTNENEAGKHSSSLENSSKKEDYENFFKPAQQRTTSHNSSSKNLNPPNLNDQSRHATKMRGNSCPGASSSTTDFKNNIEFPTSSEQAVVLSRMKTDKSPFDESGTSLGSFRARVIGRMSSAVGKRSKSVEEVSLSSPISDTLIAGKTLMKRNSHLESENAPENYAKSSNVFCQLSSSSNFVAEGWLYKRKRMTWTKQWAVLSFSKTLSFYRSKEDLKQLRPSTIINLQHGCKIDNVVQAKVNNSFTLTPNNATDDLQRLQNQKKVGSNSKGVGKRLELMSKNSHEFVHWIKCFAALNLNSNVDVKPKIDSQQTKSSAVSKQHCTEQMDTNKSTLSLEQCENLLTPELNYNQNVHPEVYSCKRFSNTDHSDTMQHATLSFKSAEDQNSSTFSSSVTKKRSADFHKDNDQFNESNSDQTMLLEINNENVTETIKSSSIDEQNTTPNMDSWNILWVDSETDEETMNNDENMQSISPANSGNNVAIKSGQNKLRESTSAEPTPVSSSSSISDAEISGVDLAPRDFATDLVRRYSLSDIAANEPDQADPTASTNKIIPDKNMTNADHTSAVEFSMSNIIGGHKSLRKSGTLCKCLDDCVTCFYCLESGDSKESKNLTDGYEMLNCLNSNLGLDRRKLSIALDPISLPFSFEPRLQNSVTHSDTTIKRSSISTRTCDRIPEAVEKSDDEEHPLKVFDRIKLFESLAESFKQPRKENVKLNHLASTQTSNITEESIVENNKAEFTEDVPQFTKGVESIKQITSDSITDHEDDLLAVADVLTNKSDDKLSVTTKEEINPTTSLKHCWLKRSNSDSIIFEPTNGKIYGMRTIKQPIPILTYIDFVETYGGTIQRHITPGKFNTSISMPSNLNIMGCEKRKHSIASDASSSSRKSYTDESSNSDSLPSLKYFSLPRTKVSDLGSNTSSGSGTSDVSSTKESRKHWWSSIAPYKLRKSLRKSSDRKASFKSQTFEIPASSLAYATHSGYLDMRTKRKQWERFWCVFQDSCLYCYNSPQSDITRDAIVLRGYEVIADVKHMNRTRFEFRVEQHGTTTLHFSTDNHQEFLLWVGTLERELRTTPNAARHIEDKYETSKIDSSLSSFSGGESSEESPTFKRSSSPQRLEQEMIEMQKHQLLKEIATQQQQLLLENRMLDSITCSTSSSSSPHIQLRRQSKRIEVLEKFDRQREEEESNATKLMALLNRRRNSAQLKVDQLARDMAPKSGKKRRENHQEFAALEAKLSEMKKKLFHVDKEIQNLQANKQNTFDKIRERQDLELFFSEQQAALSVLRHHENESIHNPVSRGRQHSSSQSGLASIDEQHICSTAELRKSISECALDSTTNYPIQRSSRSKSSYPYMFEHEEEISSSISTPSSSKSQTVLPHISSSSETEKSASLLLTPSPTEDTSLQTNRSKKAEIDPSVLAGIEEFELFSKHMLKKMQKK